jgi:hypothetical protein
VKLPVVLLAGTVSEAGTLTCGGGATATVKLTLCGDSTLPAQSSDQKSSV